MSFTSILISTYSPFPSIPLSLPSHLPISSLSHILSPLCPTSSQSLSYSTGKPLPPPHASLHSLADGKETIFLRLAVKLPGGKGGFASQLRAQGGRMSSNKASNNDSCRDLNGRRLSTIKEAKKLAALIESEPDRKAAATKAAAERLEALHQEIERLDKATSGEGKRRLEDDTFVEQSKEMVEGVKDAVKEAMMRKRKKAKLAAKESTASSSAVLEPTVPEEKEKEVEVVAEKEEAEEVAEPKGKGKGKAKGKTATA